MVFHADYMPPDLTYGARVRYVVDEERDVWLRWLGTNGPIGHTVYQLSVRGASIPFEVDVNAKDDDGTHVQQITAFGYSSAAERTYGIARYAVTDRTELRELQTLGAEAVLVRLADGNAEFGRSASHLRVKLSARAGGEVFSLASFGYGDEQFLGGETRGE